MEHAEVGQVYRGDLGRLLKKIADQRGVDFTHYRRSYLERRIAGRLRQVGLHTYRQYAAMLDADASEYEKLLDAVTVNVTDFYRDATVYEALRRQVIPRLLADKMARRQRLVRVWSAGCSTGEEPYSIAMAFLDAMEKKPNQFLLTVIATDMDRECLAKAKLAEYDVAKLKTLPRSDQMRYVERVGDTFKIRPEVTSHVKFQGLNLFHDPPIRMVDVIFCRNVFIYFNRDQQDRVSEVFWSCLHRGGYLVLGRSEKLSSAIAARMQMVNGKERIYRKL